MSKKKILQIVDNISKDSGVSSVLMNYYRNINRDLFDIDFLVTRKKYDENTYYSEIKELGGNIYVTESPLKSSTCFEANKEIETIIKSNADNYDIYHLHTPSLAFFTLKHIKEYSSAAIIIHSHSSLSSTNKVKACINKFLSKDCKKYADCYIACSDNAAKYLFGVQSTYTQKIVILNNAIDPKKFFFDSKCRERTRQRLGLRDNKCIVHVSNYSKMKNSLFLVEIIELLEEKMPGAYKLLLVGDGPQRKKLETHLNKSKGTHSFIFVGRTENVERYLNAGDFFVLPSLKEGLPLSVVEAQANGMRCLVSDSVTKEVDIGNVLFLPLDATIWADTLMDESKTKQDRVSNSYGFKKSKFDINNETHVLEQCYLYYCNE